MIMTSDGGVKVRACTCTFHAYYFILLLSNTNCDSLCKTVYCDAPGT